MALTVGSLFAGIGGFDLGFERAGFEIKWQVEIDPFCRAVLAKHWPDVRRYEDVRTVCGGVSFGSAVPGGDTRDYCGDAGSDQQHAPSQRLAPVDVICGGFPCQDISVAGAGVGIGGARSGLWSEFDRLIGELRPRYVVVENVSALLARGLGRVLGDLAAGGYDAEWDCLPASAFGAPHQRDRVWIVAYPRCELRREIRHLGSWTESKRHEATSQSQRCSPDVADADDQRQLQPQGQQRDEWGWTRDGCEALGNTMRSGLPLTRHAGTSGEGAARIFARPASNGAGGWATEPNVGRVAHGIPARVDRLRGLGNAIVPQIAEWIAHRINEAEAAKG